MTEVVDSTIQASSPLKEVAESGLKDGQVEDEKTNQPAADGGGEETSDTNVYRYIKGDLFTSEIFKVEIQNLPRFIGFNDLKKFLNKHGLNPHKIKLFVKQTFAFVTFKNQEERDKAMKAVHGMQWKGQVLSVRLAKPKADPILRKRQGDAAEVGGQPPSKRPASCQEQAEDEEPLSTQIANAVTPLWNVPYEEQLRRKEQELEVVLQRLAREIGNNNKAMLPWLFVQKEKHNNMCCPLEAIRPSPVQTEYRNKCEFVVGMGADGEDKTVGFRLGKYKGGSCAVVGPSDTIHVPTEAKRVVQAFQDYIRTTPYSVYSPETYEGHWKQLTVRTSRTAQIMAMVFFNPQKLQEEELDALKSSLKQYFTEGAGKESGVTSLYFVRVGQRTSPNTEDLPCDLVAGDEWIHEDLLGLKFRISPHSFFQINTRAAEVLYSAVGEWAQLDQDSTVLDVCCGTGTIGISLAKRVRKVIGIELCQEAVEDAKVNAEMNGLSNVEFHCGKAEDVFPTVLNALVSPNLTAIVDPPRAGLHSKVILAIRRAEHLKRLVYVACNAKAAMNNFIEAPSNRVRGAPFRPVRAMAVDLFPQTMHCENILLFERVNYSSSTVKQEAADPPTAVSSSTVKQEVADPPTAQSRSQAVISSTVKQEGADPPTAQSRSQAVISSTVKQEAADQPTARSRSQAVISSTVKQEAADPPTAQSQSQAVISSTVKQEAADPPTAQSQSQAVISSTVKQEAADPPTAQSRSQAVISSTVKEEAADPPTAVISSTVKHEAADQPTAVISSTVKQEAADQPTAQS